MSQDDLGKRLGPRLRGVAFLLAGTLLAAAPAEPLVGKWLLKSQQISGQDTAARPLILEITAVGGALQFEYSVPSKTSKAITLSFVARLDGSASDVKDAEGRKIGTAKVARASPLEYLLTLEGPNRPTASGKVKLSPDRTTLECDSDSVAPAASARTPCRCSRASDSHARSFPT